MYHIPENIASIFEPEKNYEKFFQHLISGKSKMENRMTCYYDWEPLDVLTMAEGERFIENEIGMVKMELDDFSRELMERYLSRCPGMQYVCTYTYPSTDARDYWASKHEKEKVILGEKNYQNERALWRKKIAAGQDTDGRLQAILDEEAKARHMNQYGLV